MNAVRSSVVEGFRLKIDAQNLNGISTLRRWLADRGAAERATLARLWGLPEDVSRSHAALAQAMLDPATIARLLACLLYTSDAADE